MEAIALETAERYISKLKRCDSLEDLASVYSSAETDLLAFRGTSYIERIDVRVEQAYNTVLDKLIA